MDHLLFPRHALDEMRRDSLTRDDIYTVVGDYDEKIERDDGRSVYRRQVLDGRWVVVVIETDDATVVSAWCDKRLSRRQRR